MTAHNVGSRDGTTFGHERLTWEIPRSGLSVPNFERALAAIALVALGLRQEVAFGATIGVAFAVLLCPIWCRVLRRSSWLRLLVSLGVICAVAGEILDQLALPGHQIQAHDSRATVFLVIEIVAGAGVVLWACTMSSIARVGTWFAVGMLLHAALSPGALGATNALKFSWLVPLALLVFSLVHRLPTSWQVTFVLASAGLAVTADARAFMGTAFVSAILLLWQLRPRIRGLRSYWAWTSAILVALGFAIYNLATTLLISGYLGTAAQQRSIQQVEASGSLLLGGRPELSATWALLRHYPAGFGPGVVANYHEISTAKAGMASIGYDPDNGYVDRFMFGSTIELHSTFGDIWAAFGYAGIALCIAIVALVVVNLSKVISARQGNAVVLFFGVWVLWNMMFSPLLSAAPTLVFALGALLAESIRRSDSSAGETPLEPVAGRDDTAAAIDRGAERETGNQADRSLGDA